MKTQITLLVATALLASGCGQGFSPAAGLLSNSNSSLGNDGSGSVPAPPVSDSDSAFKSYPSDGAISGGTYDQQQVITIDKEKKELVIYLPMIQIPILDSFVSNSPIPQIPGAVIGSEKLPDGSSAVALRIPLSKLLNGVESLPASRLPNGDPLPAIPDGELPSIAVQLSKRGNAKASIYLAPSVVGIFVNTSFDPRFPITLPIRNQARTKTWGYFSTVPAKGTYQGGFFLSFALPDDLARILDDIM